jgi:hypothetical protein
VIIFPSLFLQSLLRIIGPGAGHLIPNRILGFFEFFREREGEFSVFKGLCKSLYRRQIQKN